ncbi:hypothetical protein ABPG75_011309 [Micractinium tetrahymenae]
MQQAEPSITLVSKRWRDVFFSALGLWKSFTVAVPTRVTVQQHEPTIAERQAWADARLSLLQRVAGMVQVVRVPRGDELEGISAGQTARFLRCLSPAAAREVRLQHFFDMPLPAEALPALAVLTHLQRLHLASDELSGNTTSTLRQLSASLCSLSLHADSVSRKLAKVLLQLRQLTCLQLWSHKPLPRCDWCQLTALQQLAHLGLGQTHSHDGVRLEPPPPAAFPALASFNYFTEAGTLQLAGCEMCAMQYESSACQSDFLEEAEDKEAPRHNWDHSLGLADVARMDALRPLLDSLPTPRMPLRHLYLELGTPLPAAAVAGCEHQLSTLTALSLGRRLQAPADTLPAVLQALAEQAPLLADLSILDSLCGTFPAFLLHRTRLRELELAFNNVGSLPPGPYVSGLQSLTLRGEGMCHIPASLATATALTSLDLSQNKTLQLSTADMDAYVSPRLRRLRLAECRLTLLPAFGQLPGVTSLDLHGNAFTALPPALAAATSLARLDLSRMDSMALSVAEVDGLLASSPRLTRLQLSGDRPNVNEHLQRAAPHIKRN